MNEFQYSSELLAILILLAYAVMCALARLSSERKWAQWSFYGLLWLSLSLSLLFGLLLLLLQLVNNPKTAASLAQALPVAYGAVLVSIIGMALMFSVPRRWLTKIMPLSPNSRLHQFGLIFALPWLAFLVGNALTIDTQALLELIRHANVLTGTLSVQLFFVALTLIGVGTGFARNWGQSKERLGFEPLSVKQVAMAIGIAFALFGILSFGVDPLVRHFLPMDNAFQEQVMQFTKPGKTTGNVPLEIFLISASAGIGEELFFRGLLLPVLGLIPSALLFTVVHVQYGLSSAIVVVFICGLLLGYLRKRYNTTFCMLVHCVYDALALSFIALTIK